MNLVNFVDQAQIKKNLPEFRPGDTVKVYVKVVEGGRERLQMFEGVVIRRRGGGLSETFTVRRVSYGIGAERIFPLHSPKIERLEVVKHALVRQARLYYLRKLKGKAARLKERRQFGTKSAKKISKKQF